jgi:hypothetical protein
MNTQKAGRGEAYERNLRLGPNPNHKEVNPMDQADSVHSTPPTNTSAIDAPQSTGKPRSRRSVLGAIAEATAAVTVAGARPLAKESADA